MGHDHSESLMRARKWFEEGGYSPSQEEIERLAAEFDLVVRGVRVMAQLEQAESYLYGS